MIIHCYNRYASNLMGFICYVYMSFSTYLIIQSVLHTSTIPYVLTSLFIMLGALHSHCRYIRSGGKLLGRHPSQMFSYSLWSPILFGDLLCPYDLHRWFKVCRGLVSTHLQIMSFVRGFIDYVQNQVYIIRVMSLILPYGSTKMASAQWL